LSVVCCLLSVVANTTYLDGISEFVTQLMVDNIEGVETMRRYSRSRGARPHKTNYTEESLQKAIRSVKRGTSINKAALTFKIPKSTLYRKVIGKNERTTGGQLALSAEVEKRLAGILHQVALWQIPFNGLDVRYLVQYSLEKEGIRHRKFRDNFPGVDWLKGFMKRHTLTFRQSDNVKAKRYEVTEESVSHFYEGLTEALRGVPPGNIYNFDETSMADAPVKGKVIVRRGFKRISSKRNSSKAGFSVMFCGNASGDFLPPMVVYKAVAGNVYRRWVQGGPEGTKYGSTPSGWFNMNMFEQWFELIFMPDALKKQGAKILIGDNLACHFSTDVLEKCTKNNIIFFTLPPNTTHILQPLDVAVFAPLKRLWRNAITNWRKEARHTACISKQVFPSLLSRVFGALKSQNLVAGFRSTGIFPLDSDKGLTKLPGRITLSEIALDASAVEILRQHCQPSNPVVSRALRGGRVNTHPGQVVSGADDDEDGQVWTCHYCKERWQEDDNRWILCDNCNKCYHLQCSGVWYSRRQYYVLDIERMDFVCEAC